MATVEQCRGRDGWCLYESGEEISGPHETKDEAVEALRALVMRSSKGVDVLFVGGSYSPIEAARSAPMVGPVGATFRKLYIAPLEARGVACAVAYAVPAALTHDDGRPRQPTPAEAMEHQERLVKAIEQASPRCIVALGKLARIALGKQADVSMPHPGAVHRLGDSGEISRKTKAIIEKLGNRQKQAYTHDNGREIAKPSDRSPKDAGETEKEIPAHCDTRRDRSLSISIAKAIAPEQVVAGVVLDPYSTDGKAHVDAHVDWVPPQEVRAALYGWMMKSRQMKLTHAEGAESSAYPVESYIFPYPTPEDQDKAERGEPHKIYQKFYGPEDSLAVHSGAWVLFTKVPNPAEWAQIEAGELNAYSIEGVGARAEATAGEMPAVEIIRI